MAKKRVVKKKTNGKISASVAKYAEELKAESAKADSLSPAKRKQVIATEVAKTRERATKIKKGPGTGTAAALPKSQRGGKGKASTSGTGTAKRGAEGSDFLDGVGRALGFGDPFSSSNLAREGLKKAHEALDDVDRAVTTTIGDPVDKLNLDSRSAARRAIIGETPEQLALGIIPGGKIGTLGKAAAKGATAEKAGSRLTFAGRAERAASKATAKRKAARTSRPRSAARKRKKAAKYQERARVRGNYASRSTKGKAEYAWKRHKPSVLSKPGRQVILHKKAAGLGAIGAASPAAAEIATGVASTSAQAVADDPIQTLKTTGQVALGLPAGVVSLAADTYKTGENLVTGADDPFAPLKGQLEMQADYWKKVSIMAGGGARGIKLVQEKLGLIPAIGGGLTSLGLAKTFGRGSISIPPISERKMAGIVQKLESNDPAIVREGHIELEELHRKGERKLGSTARAGRRRTAEREDVGTRSAETLHAVEMRQGRKRKGRGRESLDKAVRRLNDRIIDDGVSVATAARWVAAEGIPLDDPLAIRQFAKAALESMGEPRRKTPPHKVDTRRMLKAVIRNPEALLDPDFKILKEGMRRRQEGITQERGNPNDVRAQYIHVAEREGQLFPEEMPYKETEGLVRSQPKKGQDFDRAVRREMSDDRRELRELRARKRVQAKETKSLREKIKRDEAKLAKQKRKLDEERKQNRQDIWANAKHYQRFDDGDEVFEDALRTLGDLKAKIEERGGDMTAAEVGQVRRLLDEIVAEDLKYDPDVKRYEKGLARLETAKKKLRELEEPGKQAVALAAKITQKNQALPKSKFVRAEALDRLASDIESGRLKPNDQRNALDPAELRADAEGLRREALGQSDARLDSFRRNMEGVTQRTGRETPFHVPSKDATKTKQQGNAGYPGETAPADKLNLAVLTREGRVDESAETLLQSMRDQRFGMESHRQMAAMLDEEMWSDSGKHIFSDRERDEVMNSGRLPPGGTWFALQKFERIYKADKWEEAAGLLDNQLIEEIRNAKRAKGRKYVYFRSKAGVDEFQAQGLQQGIGWRGMRRVGQAQALAMLATAPAWFAFQMFASPFVAVLANPHPARWIRTMNELLRLKKQLDPKEWARFKAEFGASPFSGIIQARTLRVDRDAVPHMRGALKVALDTPVGRALRQAANGGGPLIRMNQHYESWVRMATALMEEQKITGLTVKGKKRLTRRAHNFIRSTAGLTLEVEKHLDDLAGKTSAERVRYYEDHPEQMRVLRRKVDETVGNWGALTDFEKKVAAVTIFYPFLRFSLKWMLVSFPKNHPFKAAILANLGQANSVELERLVGEPSFFADWGNAVLHWGPDGTATTGIDVARMAPGSNALVEAVAGAQEVNGATLAKPLQPIIGIGLAAAFGTNPITGLPAEGQSKVDILAKGILGLNPFTRPLGRDIGPPPSPAAQVFAKALDRNYSLDENLIPKFTTNLDQQAEVNRLGEILRSKLKPSFTAQLIGLANAYGADQNVEAAMQYLEENKKVLMRADKAADAWKEVLKAYGIKDPGFDKLLDKLSGHQWVGADSEEDTTREPTAAEAPPTWMGGGSTPTAPVPTTPSSREPTAGESPPAWMGGG